MWQPTPPSFPPNFLSLGTPLGSESQALSDGRSESLGLALTQATSRQSRFGRQRLVSQRDYETLTKVADLAAPLADAATRQGGGYG